MIMPLEMLTIIYFLMLGMNLHVLHVNLFLNLISIYYLNTRAFTVLNYSATSVQDLSAINHIIIVNASIIIIVSTL